MRRGPGIPVLLGLVLAGCGIGIPGLSSPEPELSPDRLRFVAATNALERGDFTLAARGLRELARRCDAGDLGRTAVLLLASGELDVRNPWGSPDEAVRLAAAYQRLPDAPPGELALARTLYLLALDRGGTPPGGTPADDGAGSGLESPAEEVPPDSARPAATETEAERAAGNEPLALPRRYGRCSDGGVVERIRPLPAHPGVTSAVWRAQLRDSLLLVRDSASALGFELEAARRRIRELEAEIERIQTLLKGGGEGDRDRRP